MTPISQQPILNPATDSDPDETLDWLDSLAEVIEREGLARSEYLLERLIESGRRAGGRFHTRHTTPYRNTIGVEAQPPYPGNLDIEARITAIHRWNALAMVSRANKAHAELGGHIATYASIADLFEVGFNHFFRGATESHPGDLVYFQAHASPGVYARAFLEDRLSEDRLEHFRREVSGGIGRGLSSYPHPTLMPDFWQFPTGSMGLGLISAIYQARFQRYQENRGISAPSDRRVWAFVGDGEMDEPESMGAIGLAARENLDNLIFVINCNLQRLDGPVRGNSKIIQELEGDFRGAGWNVIKLIWGSGWDALLEKDESGKLRQLMMETVDGDYQTFKSRNGAYIREHFFGKYPETAELVKDWSDADIWALRRGGHDPQKVFAAFDRAVKTEGQPTVLLVKTVKGYGMGDAGEGLNITHQQKKLAENQLVAFRDRFKIPVDDKEIAKAPYVTLGNEQKDYILKQREALGGPFPLRRHDNEPLQIPSLSAFDAVLKDTGDRQVSTTMAFVRVLNTLIRDKNIGKQVVPIVPDESRTFGMEGMFRQVGIYNPKGQLYTPEDADQLSYYKESASGQVLQEGINEAGAMADWIAAATAYSVHGVPMIPFYIYYSMFGFQRIGDLAWAAGDMRTRGFLMGGTAGRTTLAGEGLQHQDGHSHLLASMIPNCVAYDPTFGYELAVIVHDGLERMYGRGEDVYYYITIMNENYEHPPMPEGAAEGIRRGMYLLRQGGDHAHRVQLVGSGAILREVLQAAERLESEYGVSADVWSATSFNELRREGIETDRWNRLHPEETPRISYVEQCLKDRAGPVIAASDYVRGYADQIRNWVPAAYHVLGTDGFGRSDTRSQLRRFFEVDARHVTATALYALAGDGSLERSVVTKAMQALDIDPERVAPWKS